MNRTPIKALHEKKVENCKKWLLGNSTINFSRGLSEVLFNLYWLGPFTEEQAEHFQTKLMEDKKFVGMQVTADSGIIFVNGVVTLEANPHEPILSQYYSRSV